MAAMQLFVNNLQIILPRYYLCHASLLAQVTLVIIIYFYQKLWKYPWRGIYLNSRSLKEC